VICLIKEKPFPADGKGRESKVVLCVNHTGQSSVSLMIYSLHRFSGSGVIAWFRLPMGITHSGILKQARPLQRRLRVGLKPNFPKRSECPVI